MISNWLSTLRETPTLIREVYFAPGDFVLSTFAELAPVTAAAWGIGGNGDAVMTAAAISGVFWLLLSIVAWRLYRYGRSLVRNVIALSYTAWYRLRQAAGSLKTHLTCRLREFVPSRRDDGIDAVPEIDFDDVDLAILRSAAARGPGLATSAPDIAEKFRLRPSEVQRSVDKLHRNRMLETVIGSTDGYDNFRLSPYGASFVAMWQRQHES